MLQQTRVDTVIPYYFAFLERFPTIRSLAEAEESSVLKAWQGLGYYSRARNLHQAAKVMVAAHGGAMPEEPSEIRSLPGVGPYTAGAVASIAFNLPIPAVDGNVLRVMTRFLGIRAVIESTTVKRAVTTVVTEWLQQTEPRILTQALMELGAMVCTPRSPSCTDCPISGECVARALALTGEIPVRKEKPAKKRIDVYALWIESERGVLVEERPRDGLLGGLWQLPSKEVPRQDEGVQANAHAERILSAAFAECAAGRTVTTVSDPQSAMGSGVAARDSTGLQFAPIAQEKHVFTHLEWFVTVYRPVQEVPGQPFDATGPYRWMARESLTDLAWPRVYERLLEQLVGRLV